MEIKSGVYVITNIVNGKIYIGSSVNIKKRWREHKNDLKKNKHHSSSLQKSYNKHGLENFIFEIIEFVDCKELFIVEQKYLDQYKPYERSNGYNISRTAKGPTGVNRDDLVSFNIQNKSKKVFQYDLNGKFIKEWFSITEASLFYNIHKSNISKNCLKKTNKFFGYIWSFEYKNYVSTNIIQNKKKKKVLQYTINDVFLQEWNSLTEASQHLNILISKISLVCSKKRKTAGGFKWKYKYYDNEKK
jgi:group I intron endonuclease